MDLIGVVEKKSRSLGISLSELTISAKPSLLLSPQPQTYGTPSSVMQAE